MRKRKKYSLVLGVFFFCIVCLTQPSATAVEETATRAYSIDLEWGSLSFTYDKGTWDTEALEYKKQDSSVAPAKDTVDGQPGWYEFNGENNKIWLQNASQTETVTATIEVVPELRDAEGNALQEQPDDIQNLAFSLYKDNQWNCFDGYPEGSNTKITQSIPSGGNVAFYISIAGELNTSTAVGKNIGSVTISISK